MTANTKCESQSKPTILRSDSNIVHIKPKRLNIGEILTEPFAQRLPASIHPNTITYINTICNWTLFFLAFTAPHFQPYNASIAFIGCSFLNLLCTILDCLDGMHARRTKQTSKLGEFLDHFFDALHVPLIGAGILYAMRYSSYSFAGVQILNSCVYATQLMTYYFTHVFIQTDGVESQVTTSVLYCLAAIVIHLPVTHPFVYSLQWILLFGGVAVHLKLIFDYVRVFSLEMWTGFVQFLTIEFFLSYLYVSSTISVIAFAILHGLVSFLVVGSYVLFAIIHKPFVSHFASIMISFIILGAANTFLPAIPLPLVFPALESKFDATVTLTTHDIAPYIVAMFLTKSILQLFNRHYLILKNM